MGSDLTGSLSEAAGGDPRAADALFEALYQDLRVRAGERLRHERAGHSLTPTALVHEAYARLIDQTRAGWKDREHFLKVAARVMRHVLVDHARARLTDKRGGGAAREPDDATRYYQEALEKRRRVLGEEHPSTLVSISNMGFLLHAQGERLEAEPYFREVLEKYRRVLGEEHPDTLVSTNNMGTLLKDQGKFEMAEAVLLPAAAIADAKLPPQHEARRALIANIVRLYRAWDKAEPGKGYDAKRAEWTKRLKKLIEVQTPAP